VIKANERAPERANSKLNKTNKNQHNEQLEVALPTINKGKRLAQIDGDNYEEDFVEENTRKPKIAKSQEELEIAKGKQLKERRNTDENQKNSLVAIPKRQIN